MSKLDNYVKHLINHGAAGLIMRANQMIQLRTPDGAPKTMKKVCTEDEIRALVQEVMDDDAAASYMRGGSATFEYEAAGYGVVNVAVERTSSGLRCEVTLVDGPPVEPAPSPRTPARTEAAPRRTQGIQMTPASAAPSRTQGVQMTPASTAAPSRTQGVQMTPPSTATPARTQNLPAADSGRVATINIPAPSSAQPRQGGNLMAVAPAQPEVLNLELPEPEADAPPELILSDAASEPAINLYLRKMVEARASDLHLRSDTVPALRVSGGIVLLGGDRLSADTVSGMLLEVCSAEQQRNFREKHDLDFAHAIPGVGRFRMNYFLDRKGPGMVARLIPEKVLSLEELGAPAGFKSLCELNRGLVLVTGPTGSGKSTTLAAMIDYINSHKDEHILTLEDPIEFVHTNKKCLITQREIHTHTETFATALRAALREDPDTILVGEMRDLETISLAIETAETGHLVFGTLHTNTASSTVDRVIDVFPADRQAQVRSMLANSLKGVIAQTLVRRIGGGRAAAYEVMIGTFSVANMIREGKTHQLDSIIQTSKNHGMMTMNDSLLNLVQKKLVAPEDAYDASLNKSEMRKHLMGLGWQGPPD